MLWNILTSYKYFITFIAVASTAISVGVALLSTPIYRADILLAPVSKGGQGGGISGLAGQFGGLASLAGINIGGASYNGKEINLAKLSSRAFTEHFIKENKLIPALFFDDNGVMFQSKADFKNPNSNMMWDAYKQFNEIRKISEDKKTGLITLSIEWTDPMLAAKWANGLVALLNNRLRSDAIGDSKRNLKYLREQIEKTSIVVIQQSMFGLIEGEIKKAMLANVSNEFAFNIIDPAVPPKERIKPKRRLIVTLGLIIGVFLGVFMAYLSSYIKLQTSRSSVIE